MGLHPDGGKLQLQIWDRLIWVRAYKTTTIRGRKHEVFLPQHPLEKSHAVTGRSDRQRGTGLVPAANDDIGMILQVFTNARQIMDQWNAMGRQLSGRAHTRELQ